MPDHVTVPPASYGPPAKNVLVYTLCGMNWSGPGNASTGLADNGSGDTPVDVPGMPTHYGYDGGEKYQVMDGSSGTITYDVDVSSTVNGTMNDYNTISVNVGRSLSVSCNPISLYLGGPTRDTSGLDNILIGQSCYAGVYTQTPQASIRNYNWTMTCATFKDYYVAPDFSSAHVDFLTPADLTSSSPSWYWLSEGSAVVSVSADVYVSVGGGYSGLPLNTIINIATITDTHPVNVMCPVYYCDPKAGKTGNVEVWENPDVNNLWLSAVGKYGIKWTGSVTPQPIFGSIGNGRWNFVQKFQPDRSYTLMNGVYYEWSINGHDGLDSIYPYPAWEDSRFDDPITPGWYDNGSPHFSHDASGEPLTNDIASRSIGDTFKTYMMYKPLNGTWVPLHRISWQWSANVSQPP